MITSLLRYAMTKMVELGFSSLNVHIEPLINAARASAVAALPFGPSALIYIDIVLVSTLALLSFVLFCRVLREGQRLTFAMLKALLVAILAGSAFITVLSAAQIAQQEHAIVAQSFDAARRIVIGAIAPGAE
jgi:hypothetical protein